MADVEQDESTESNFEDDLDKMLEETVEQLGADATSQEAIDELLSAEDSDTSSASVDNVDELVDTLLDETVKDQESGVIDEFGEDPVDSVEEKSGGDLVDDLLDKSLEEDVIDEFGETPEEVQAAEASKNLEEEPATFDISDEDATFAEESPAADIEMEAKLEEPAVAKPTSGTKGSVEQTTEKTQVISLEEFKAQDEKIAILSTEMENLKKGADHSEAIEAIISNEKKSQQEAESAYKKLKIFSLCALVIAILATGIGSTVLFFYLQLEDKVEEARNLIIDIEDELAVNDVNPNDKKISTLQAQVTELQSILDASIKEFDLFTAKISSEINETTDLSAALKADVAKLEENITSLENEVEQLKKAKSTRRAARNAKKKINKPREWVVNLVSFKQRWYTDKKVESFSQQGIPTEVIAIDVDGVQWFRIRAVGFSNKAAAKDYAEKAKKVLNLSSVWVSTK